MVALSEAACNALRRGGSVVWTRTFSRSNDALAMRVFEFRLDDATSQMNAALRLDPLGPNILFTRGWALFWSGHLPEA
jgi:hypothetical protein